MKLLSFKNRIALNYIVGTGLLVLAVFSAIYFIVKLTVYNHIDENLNIEVQDHLKEVKVENGVVIMMDAEEWEEREHNSVDVNPVFVQFLDLNKKIIEKSPNLKNEKLVFHNNKDHFQLFDTKLLGNKIRQIQVPLHLHSKKIGYLIIAMSLSDSSKVLDNLMDTLLVTFPIILLILFFLARFFAGRSIKPINDIIQTSNIITKDNLKTRIPLPKTRDELYTLSKTINNLLNRIEDAIEREKQFTSDASHELRTPLTVIKGTLEVLIRKPRDSREYEDKINYCINEVDHLNMLVDQLLTMARFENQKHQINAENVYLNAVILDVLTLNSEKINSKKLKVKFDAGQDYYTYSDNFLIITILRNIISNSLKYTKDGGEVSVFLSKEGDRTICRISDNGIGIAKGDLEMIFNPFFRSNYTDHPEIKGVGLGLSIVKRITEQLDIQFKIESKIGVGTTVILGFKEEMKTIS
ncbi:sensor histidine kinase [Flavobacterium johnsoniae]|uniref:histidine kinase n=1 Tax=Flavobacterium johnsoniae (strain ATCC 17061 / DSM 2064 / JCM 8514 / BCRC 14874 / CCUG 350202 / NBRC 14942 / NCIMB 11054 / UW101) TaxID=376686 RepID=A5FFW7_FLAJ1|nr:HAMP domain-containing sensor histidine kinase [Flavobacterium johnsoniae]ABQ05900.1 integral membrane sensor signal transduction histidine kinase [Flavobacterium johnsoniae UW101]OXE95534.1 two-component sensor histidine kinase [Flavobacterium johnsoniae UW101]WQG81636.1 HAMP domain-containing sensor histidine kinase [Flavobacterium johnsoniae UW101]SHK59476.1 Signal transduction histidine kinase [Flavobacterium johnsoniae]